ncbi:bifunctional metallophosphatase/5'-nucleotidase [Myxococcota bacterium]|nr:bifunctional metallophosphatase/5'-nucleotidase [Myxococcota bacterium]
MQQPPRVLGRHALAVTLAALATAPACYVVTEPSNLAGQDVHLTVLHTSDLHARLLPYYQVPGLIDRGLGLCAELQPFGGAARMQHLLKRERAKSDRVMHLDSGDMFQGAPIFNEFKGEVEVRVMGAFDADGVVIGNHEFDLGSANVANQYGMFGKGQFPMLAANYLWADPSNPNGTNLGALVKPYEILNLDGLRVAVIGMGNTSSMTSIAQGGNSLGITPLEPVEVLRTLVDQLSGQVDLVFVVSHMGLTSRGTLNLAEDQEMITGYEKIIPKDAIHPNWEVVREEPNGQVLVRVPGVVGVDAIFGGHLHIVLNPPKVLIDPAGRQVVLVHSGAFAKFFGRADLVVRVPKADEVAPFGAEIVSHSYSLFPITGRVPKKSPASAVSCPVDDFDPVNGDLDACPECKTLEVEEGNDNVGLDTQCQSLASAELESELCQVADACRAVGDACTAECRDARRRCGSVPAPVDGELVQMLDPYVQKLYQKQDLNKGFAFATDRITRFGLSGEDSPLGNLVADSMRFRNRVEAQFAMTNTLGIRTNMERGLVTLEEMFNIFPFENTLTTMYLSGTEVQELFDYVTERSSERGCQTQAQISGVTFTMNCAQAIMNISDPPTCETELDCQDTEFARRGANNPAVCRAGRCYKSPAEDILINGEPVNPTESYKAAVNDFIGRGGSGFEVLRRNTTKVNTGLSLRDALIDYMRSKPEDGGPGRVCGSTAMVEPLPTPAKPLVVYDKTIATTASCDSKPNGCTSTSGIYVDCTEDERYVRFYCIPFDFPDPSSAIRGDECDELARVAPVFERYEGVQDDPNIDYCATPLDRSCPGQLHCCTKPTGTVDNLGRFQPDGFADVTFYCMVPLCIDPPETGRIRRVVQ